MEYDLDDLEMLTDGEDEEDTTTFTEVLRDLGVLGQIEPTKYQPDDIEMIRTLLHGLTLAQKGHEMLAKGCSEIKTVVARAPSMHKLQGLIEVIKSTDPSLVEAARASTLLPQTGKLSKPQLYKPQKVGKAYQCRVCQENFGSWTGCDSHIRAKHTNVQYGPCRYCHAFSTPAYDSFKRHEAACIEKKSNFRVKPE